MSCWDICFQKISQTHYNVDLTFYNTINYGFMKSHFSICVLAFGICAFAFSICVFFINLFILLYLKQITIQFWDHSSTLQETDLIPSFHSRHSNQLLQSLILVYQPINSCGRKSGKAPLLICENQVILNYYLIPAKLTQIFVIILKMF